MDSDEFPLFTVQKNPHGCGPDGLGRGEWTNPSQTAILPWSRDISSILPDSPGLQAALAVPMSGVQGMVGVISLYRKSANSFTGSDLNALTSVSRVLTATLERTVHCV